MSAPTRRIACVQINPAHGQVKKNIERVRDLTRNLKSDSLDMLVLPEMALTGYIFSSSAEIDHLLEDPHSKEEDSSPSLQVAKQLATRLLCYVVIGFPMREKAPAKQIEMKRREHSPSFPFDARPVELVSQDVADGAQGCYNAALLVDSRGELVHIFKKHFSYENDKTWACEGPGYQSIDLPKLGRVCVAICMDLSPYDFKAPFESFELAKYCKNNSVDILIMPMAWLIAKNDEDSIDDDSDSTAKTYIDTLREGPHEQTINYWALRLSPFLEDQKSNRDFYFVNCNRTGTEQTSKFAGSSCALHFSQKVREERVGPPVALLGAMGRQEGVQVFHLYQ